MIAQKLEDLKPNAQLGHYTIIEHIAEGGMGHVFRAFEPGLQRDVAIKVLKSELAQDEQYQRFFQEEAQNIAALRHANIVPIYYIGQQGELSYFAMAFIEGSTLDDWIEANKKMTVEEARWVLSQAIEALDWARKHNIIHLDIKPSNFLIDPSGAILLTDFGLARSLSTSEDSETRECYGTPAYICPEQILNRPCDQRSDIYSLGATMYHLMTMRLLHDGDTLDEIIMGHLEAPFPYAEAEAEGLPPGWINLFDRMTQKNPEDRFQNYDELRKAVQTVDRLKPVVVRSTSEEVASIPVPNNSSYSSEMLYGLLSPSCANWTHSGIDHSLRRKRSDMLQQIENPLTPFKLESLTRGIKELSQGSAGDPQELINALQHFPEVHHYLMELAANPAFGESAPGDPLEALNRLGLDLSTSVILAGISLNQDFTPSDSFNWQPLWQHSISVGVTAYFILKSLDGLPTPTTAKKGLGMLGQISKKYMTGMIRDRARRHAFAAGFYHDIGKLLLGEVSPYSYYACLRIAMEETTPLPKAEKESLGIDHQEIGVMWMTKIGAESWLKDVVAHHNEIEGRRPSQLSAAVSVANQLVKRQGIGFSGNPVVELRDPSKSLAWEELMRQYKDRDIPANFLEETISPFVAALPLLRAPSS